MFETQSLESSNGRYCVFHAVHFGTLRSSLIVVGGCSDIIRPLDTVAFDTVRFHSLWQSRDVGAQGIRCRVGATFHGGRCGDIHFNRGGSLLTTCPSPGGGTRWARPVGCVGWKLQNSSSRSWRMREEKKLRRNQLRVRGR